LTPRGGNGLSLGLGIYRIGPMPKFSFLVVGSLALLAAAVLLLKAALAKAPNNADAWNLMGYAHRKLGQVDQALGFYQKALSLNAEHRGALEYLGELYLQTGRPKQAKEMLKRLDDACFFGCEEYDDLKKAFQVAKVID